MSRILVLGAGFVAGPLVEYLSRRKDNTITLASQFKQEAEALVKERDIRCEAIDVTDEAEISALAVEHDVVVSLVPYVFHPLIAKVCIRLGIHLVTASYESDAMRELAGEAEKAGITIINEIGLDPGIDHLTAMKVIDDIHNEGGKVETFISWCGGLPAPDSNNNPLGYKFSWSPRGVLLALLNDATYLRNGQAVNIKGKDLLSSATPLDFSADLQLEGYANRNSLGYKQVYGIPETKNLLRGTLRYRGFSVLMNDARKLGLLDAEPCPILAKHQADMSWREYMEARHQMTRQQLLTHFNITAESQQGLEWLGVLSEDSVAKATNVLDAFCSLLQRKLAYAEGERDMIAMQHKFVARYGDDRIELRRSTMVCLGEVGGYSAMAKTVGYPAAIATQMLADGLITQKGLVLPVDKSLYLPILEKLEEEGIACQDEVLQEVPENFLRELD